MGSAAPFLTLFALLGAPTPDTATYADRATNQLVARAMLRHAARDTTVRDYRAKLRYRLSFGLGKRRWADVPAIAAEEQEGTIAWQLPNDLRVDLLGRRSASRMEGVNLASSFGRPWFVPRTLGDSIRVFGSETPDRAAPHPLAAGADRHYRYAAGDSLTISAGGRRITIRSVTITPKSSGGAYVAGRLWLDVGSGDVARFTFRFVGTDLWAAPDSETSSDSAEARRTNRFVSRILQLDADLEYGLQDRQHWMPFRQVLSGRVTVPFGANVIVPFEATTTFDDYAINGGTPIVFDAPFRDTTRALADTSAAADGRRAARDTLRAERRAGVADSLGARDRTGYLSRGGRYQIHRPPADSLRAYDQWGDSLDLKGTDADRARIREAVSDLATMTERLPPEMTGRAGAGIAWERVGEMIRYNRVQGTTLSATGRARAPLAFTDLQATVRFGFADQRLMARIAAVRDAPRGRTTLAFARDLIDLDPFARGLSFSNSLRAMLTGHDDGDYVLAAGARVTHESSLGLGTELTLGASLEDHESVSRTARAGVPRIFGSDGRFPGNPEVREGVAFGVQARIDRFTFGSRWTAVVDAMSVAGEAGIRAAGEVRMPRVITRAVTARIKVGVASTDAIPQLALRAGGINTVRGFDFGTTRGDAAWAAQFDIMSPGRGMFKPFAFADAGQAGRIAAFGDAPLLAGAGAGVSILQGIVRAELSHPITTRHGNGLRFDLVFATPW